MDTYIFWTTVLFTLAALIVGGLWVARTFLGGVPQASTLFKPKGDRRLGVVESVSIDVKRRLVLVRRDGVEHLLLTGGPSDVVVETGIDGSATRNGARIQPKT